MLDSFLVCVSEFAGKLLSSLTTKCHDTASFPKYADDPVLMYAIAECFVSHGYDRVIQNVTRPGRSSAPSSLHSCLND